MKIILAPFLTSDEEEGGRERAAGIDLQGAFLDEAPEGGDAGAGADHDEGCVGDVEGEVEGLMARFDVDVDAVAFLQVGEVVGCDAEEAFALALEGFFVNDAPCESAGTRIGKRRGGD